MEITPLVWGITIAVTIAFFVYEFFAHVRKPHEPSIGESARWSAFYIGLALIFGVVIGLIPGWGWVYSGEYFAGYLTEKALSIDNLFVFLIVMTGFAVPKIYQQKVLMIGIVIALILRGLFIAARLGHAALPRKPQPRAILAHDAHVAANRAQRRRRRVRVGDLRRVVRARVVHDDHLERPRRGILRHERFEWHAEPMRAVVRGDDDRNARRWRRSRQCPRATQPPRPQDAHRRLPRRRVAHLVAERAQPLDAP